MKSAKSKFTSYFPDMEIASFYNQINKNKYVY
ncbi:hypothetical protein ACV566_12805 [Staphylococcus aureus]